MTRDQLQQLFPHASESTIQLNTAISGAVGGQAPNPVVECGVRARSLAKGKAKGAGATRFFVRVTSYRRRLLDEDNLCAKYVVDCCRYAGLLPGDGPGQARIVTTQEKVGSKDEERTEVVIEEIK